MESERRHTFTSFSNCQALSPHKKRHAGPCVVAGILNPRFEIAVASGLQWAHTHAGVQRIANALKEVGESWADLAFCKRRRRPRKPG